MDEPIHITRQRVGYPAPLLPPTDHPNSWKLYTRATVNIETGRLRTTSASDIDALGSLRDKEHARSTLRKLSHHCQNGQPLHLIFDSKQYHPAHHFTYDGPPSKKIDIYRVRLSGDIRIYLLHLYNKHLLILKIDAKREDKLSAGELATLENLAKEILDAAKNKLLIEIQP